MGSQASDVSPTYPAEVVALAFVEKYYQILHSSPQHAHHFYQDSSVLGRPGEDGAMTSVTTMQGIGDKIMSLDYYKDSLATIVTVYAQESIMGGVIVGVTGFLTGNDNLKRNFSQTFFLAPQEKGYFVLNDFLHFTDSQTPPAPLSLLNVEENALVSSHPTQEKGATVSLSEVSAKASSQSEMKNSSVEEVAVSDQLDMKNSSVEEVAVSDQLDMKNSSVEEVAVSDQLDIKNSSAEQVAVSEASVEKLDVSEALVEQALSETSSNKSKKTVDLSSNVQKTSYASILVKKKIVTSVTAANSNEQQQQPRASTPKSPGQKPPASASPHPRKQSHAPVSPNNQRPLMSPPPNSNHQQPHDSIATRASGLPNQGTHLNSNRHAGATGIYIGGLPTDINYLRIKAAVDKFGDVKQDGIQIRRCEDGFTFGFVEFELPKSAQNAVEAGTIEFGEKEAYIVFKRSNMQGGVNRRGMPPSAGGGGGGGGYYGNGNNNNRNRGTSNREGHPNMNRGGGGGGGGGGYNNGEGNGNRRRGLYQNFNRVGGGPRQYVAA